MHTQGHESDIVILSLVRKNNKSKIGFLSDKTRQVVALSRQRRALCIIGSQQHMGKSPTWKVHGMCILCNCVCAYIELLAYVNLQWNAYITLKIYKFQLLQFQLFRDQYSNRDCCDRYIQFIYVQS